ncbi:MAG: hypothetical protein RR942_01130 [Romboutsia sp.]
MKIICGNWNRINFIQDYINTSKGKEIMVVDITGDKMYRSMNNVSCKCFESGDGDVDEVILELYEYPYKIDEVILLTNECVEKTTYFKRKFSNVDKDVTICLLSNTGVRVDPHIQNI